jgi:hypothetical protein
VDQHQVAGTNAETVQISVKSLDGGRPADCSLNDIRFGAHG